MRKLVYVAIVALVACTRKETNDAPPASVPAATAQSSSSSTAEDTYPMTATLVSRDPAKNTINLDNMEVPGKMSAMKMDYQLRGAKVTSLPADGSAVVVTMHDLNGKYWVTDVKPQPKR